MERQKPMEEKDKHAAQRRHESTPQSPAKQADKQPAKQPDQWQKTPGSFPGERSDSDSIGQPVQLDSERPEADRQRPTMDREKQPK